jgi:hypothetical protein
MGYSQAAIGDRQDILILPGPNALAFRLWHQIQDAYRIVGIDSALLEVVQGSYNPGGVEASGTTHADGGTYDLRLRGISDDEAEALCVQLRRMGACAWPRIPRYGWLKGRHIHAVDRFEPDLSRSARWQVAEYDAGRNALSGDSSAPDPLPHPEQTKYEYQEDDVALSDEDIQKIVDAVVPVVVDQVWATKMVDPASGDTVSMRTLVGRIRLIGKNTYDEVRKNGGPGTAPSAGAIATVTADLLAERLRS